MTIATLTEAPAELAPVASAERIQALDVVRGFALIGIFLMNVEFFNRAMAELGQGLPATATGADWWAGWFVYMFVQGKFWTMFSLLFGMGFAVMLTRAERAGRDFFRPYLRRIAALAVFGALHHIFIWGGDILFSYAVAAVGLLIVMYGNWKYILAAIVVLLALGFVPVLEPLRGVAAGLAMISIAALFLRWQRRSRFFGRTVPTFSAIFLWLGALLVLVAIAMWIVPAAPAEARIPMSATSIIVLLIGVLSARYHEPEDVRPRRLGVAMYLFPFLMMGVFSTLQYYAPKPPEAVQAASQAVVAGKAAAPVDARAAAAAKQKAERKAEQDKWLKKQDEKIARQKRVYSSGTYAEAVRMRAEEFAEHAPNEAGFATILVGMFLLGAWFVRSGVMENTGAHLPLFRKLALYGIPFGVGLGLLGSMIATARTPGLENDPYMIAMSMLMIGNLPACLGYVSLIVLMLHSRSFFNRIAVLAPLGRMALTNYLTHSVLGTLVFYGYGLGYWGTGRAMQVVFVFVVIFLQVLFCTWWLSRFRYGPMEWLWRVITYWKLTPIRRDNAVPVHARQASA